MFKSDQRELPNDSGWRKARSAPDNLLFYLLKNIQLGFRRWDL